MKNDRSSFAVYIVVMFVLIGIEVLPVFCGFIDFTGEALAQTNEAPKLVPAFADRSRIPAAGKQGPPAEAATHIGDWNQGETLFAKNCQSCHGPQGTGKVPNPGSNDGTVPPLNPIDPELANKNPSVFAANIDRIIQHGSIPDGSHPVLFMPNWGDSKNLSQKEIADLESYIMHLNGVRASKKK
jgi:mono/diheme cytochrome c family protein